jgi:hypothetical protein
MPLSRSASISPGVLVLELRAVIAMLQSSGGTRAKTNARSVLRLIEVASREPITYPVRRVSSGLGAGVFRLNYEDLPLVLFPRSS